MIRAMLMGTLALTCLEPAQAQEWIKLGGEPDPLGRAEPVQFLKYATAIEPAESDLELAMFVLCGDESSEKATVQVRLFGSHSDLASGAARIDGGEIADISWFRSERLGSNAWMLSGFGSIRTLFDEQGQEQLKAILTGGSEAILSFEPFGGEDTYFRLNLAGLAARIGMCENGSPETRGERA